jgi:hypothetical protein
MAHFTPLLNGSLFTVATMFATVPPACTEVAGAVIDNEIASTVIVTDADATGSATEVAVMVTCKSVVGGVGGAV